MSSEDISLLDIGYGLVDVFSFLRPRHTMNLLHTCVEVRKWFDTAATVAKAIPAYTDRPLTTSEALRLKGNEAEVSQPREECSPPRWSWSPVSLNIMENHCTGDFCSWVPWLSTVGLSRDCQRTHKLSVTQSKIAKNATVEQLVNKIAVPERTIINLRAYAMSTFMPKLRVKLINDDEVCKPLETSKERERRQAIENLKNANSIAQTDDDEYQNVHFPPFADGDLRTAIVAGDSALRGLVAKVIVVTSMEGIESVGNYFCAGSSAKMVVFAKEVLPINESGRQLEESLKYSIDSLGARLCGSAESWEARKRQLHDTNSESQQHTVIADLPVLPARIGKCFLASCPSLTVVNFGCLVANMENSVTSISDLCFIKSNEDAAATNDAKLKFKQPVVLRGIAPIGEEDQPLDAPKYESKVVAQSVSDVVARLCAVSPSQQVLYFDSIGGVLPLSALTTVGNWWLSDCERLAIVSFDRRKQFKHLSVPSTITSSEVSGMNSFGPLIALSSVGDNWIDYCPELQRAYFAEGLPSITQIGCKWLSYCQSLKSVAVFGSGKDVEPSLDAGSFWQSQGSTKFVLRSPQSSLRIGNGWLQYSPEAVSVLGFADDDTTE